jgi:O-antigen/teichoic acid export membrane protein
MAEISATKRIAKNFSWLLVGNVLSGLFNFVAIVYIARILGAASFGLFNFAQAFLAYLVLLVDSGLSALGMREVARGRDRPGAISLNILTIRLLISGMIYLIAIFILYIIPISFEVRWLFLATFLFVFYRAFSPEWIFQGLERMEYMATLKVLYVLISLALFIIFVKSPHDLIRVPLIQFACGLAVASVFILILFRRIISFDIKFLDPAGWPGYFLRAMPLGASMIMIQIYNNLDTIMLGFMDKAAVVGYYNAAYKIFYVFVGVFSTWQAPAIPISAKQAGENRSKEINFIEKYLRLTLMAAWPITVLITIASPLIIRLFFGGEYLPASQALQILIWSFMFFVVSITYGNLILINTERSWEYMRIVAAGALINVVLNFLLIPRFSLNGAAAATLLTEILVCFLVLYYSKRVFNVRTGDKLINPFLASIPSVCLYMLVYNLTATLPFYFRFLSAAGGFIFLYAIVIYWLEREFLAKLIREVIKTD